MSAIGFIGAGNMGSAIIKGLAAKGVRCCATDLNRQHLASLQADYGLTPKDDPRQLVRDCRIIVLAVKPQQMSGVLAAILPELTPGHCLVSIAAGLTQERLRELVDNVCAVVRVMPNTPALVGAGVAAITFEGASQLDEATRTEVRGIFEAVGLVFELAEKDFDAFTGVVGSGPAYVFYVMEALIEAAVNLGLPRLQATGMVQGLLVGSAKLADESGLSATVLREMVTSPGGTTIKGLLALDRHAVRAAIMDCVEASYLRSKELAK